MSRFSARYLAALSAYLEHGPPASLSAAHELGCQAATIGWGTLDLARMHDCACLSFQQTGDSPRVLKGRTQRAARFFKEFTEPVEKTHRIAREIAAELKRVNAILACRTKDLLHTKRELERRVINRREAEAALQASSKASSQLLKQTHLLERQLQIVTHKMLASDEAERRKMSLLLQDEIAQMLVGIHVKLATLRKEAAVRHASLAKEIAITQRLVARSVKIIQRLDCEFNVQPET